MADVTAFEQAVYATVPTLATAPTTQPNKILSSTIPPGRTQPSIRDAMALYQGEFLANFYVADAPDFESWARAECERLHRLCHNALTALIANSSANADTNANLQQAIMWANQLLQLEPTDEQTHSQLMKLYMRNGQRSSALAQYERCREILAAELAVDPAAETTALYHTIRQGDSRPLATEHNVPAVGMPDAPTAEWLAHRTTGTKATGRISATEPTLVGRGAHRQQILREWQQRVPGQPHFCLIRGEAGIGKTRLAEAVLQWADKRGVATARARAYAAAGELAYTPVIDWLRSAPLQRAVAHVEPVWQSELTRLLPELPAGQSQPVTASHTSPFLDSQWQRQRLFDALVRTFQTGTEPKILLLDDLQWCDRETLAWVHYLLQTPLNQEIPSHSSSALLIIATARPEILHSDHPFQPILLRLRSEEKLTEVNLEPLDEAATTTLAAQIVEQPLTPSEATKLYEYTTGNPLFVIETLRKTSWQKDLDDTSGMPPMLPTRVQAVIQERLATLSPAAYRLAGLTAVIGRAFDFTLLTQASKEPAETLIASLDQLWQQGIIKPHGNQRYDFSHDRIREVAYLTVSPVQRPLWHRQVAEALKIRHAEDQGPVSAQLAYHCEVAGDVEGAIAYYRMAAERAHLLFDNTDAIQMLECALGLVKSLPASAQTKKQELNILTQLREPLIIVRGYYEPSLKELAHRAQILAQEVGDPLQLIKALHMLRLYHHMRGDLDKSLSLSREIIEISERENSNFSVEDHYPMAHTLVYRGEFISARYYFDQVFAYDMVPPNPMIFGAKNLWLLGYPEQALHYAERALDTALEQNQPHLTAFVKINLSRFFHLMRQIDVMKHLCHEALALEATLSNPLFLALCKIFQGRVWAEDGETARGIELIETTLANLRKREHAAFHTHNLGLLAEAYGLAHQFSNALTALEQALVLANRHGEYFWHAELIRLRGEYHHALGASAGKVATCYEEAIAIAQAQQAKSLELRATMSLARLWQEQGQHAAALARLSEIYNWFTEGFNTADLRDAKALLVELRR